MPVSTLELVNVANVHDNLTLNLGGQPYTAATAVVGGTTYLFASAVAESGLSVFSVAADGALTNVFNVNDDATLNLRGFERFATAEYGGDTYLLVGSGHEGGISLFRVGTDGHLTSTANVSDADALNLNGISALASATVDGTTYFFASGYSNDSGVSVFSVGPGGTLANVFNNNIYDPGLYPALWYPSDMATAVVGGATYLFVTGSVGDGVTTQGGLTAFRVNADGSLTRTATIVDDATLNLATAEAVTTAQIGSQTWVFVAGFTDNGISMFSVESDGSLTNVANVSDDATLNLGGVHALTTVMHNGTTYLLAASYGDSGISAFAIGTDDSLTPIANLSDDATMQLAGAVDLASATVGGHAYAFAMPSLDGGLGVFTLDNRPTATNLSQTHTIKEDQSIGLPDIVVSDIDVGDTITATLTLATPGVAELTPFGGATYNPGTGVWTVTGTVAEVNAALAGVRFIPSPNIPFDNTITTHIEDLAGVGPADGTISITMTPVNDPPLLTNLASSVTFLENTVNATPQIIDADVNFVDPDQNYNGGTLTVTGILPEDTVSIRSEGLIDLSGGVISYSGTAIGTALGGNGSTLTATFNGNAQAHHIEALIEHLIYGNSSDTPTASRALEITVADAAGTTNGFKLTSAGAGFDYGFESAPRLVDLDRDGDLDQIVGADDGTGHFHYLKNIGSETAPNFVEQFGADNPLNGIAVGRFPSATFGDLDSDRDQDMVVGALDGALRYFENIGSETAAAFTERTGAANPFNGIDVGTTSRPSDFVDLDNDGDLDLVVGEDGPGLHYFENTGSVVAPVFVERTGAANPFNGVSLSGSGVAAFADIDRDGDFDAIVGENNGTVNYYENTGSANAPSFTERTGSQNPFDLIGGSLNARPALGDLDGDGDLDLLTGDWNGSVNFARNTGRGQQIVVNVTPQDETAANTIPSATNLTQTKTYTEGDATLALDDIVVTDPDAGETITATLTLDFPAAGSLTTSGGGSYTPATGIWTVTGTVAAVNAALAAVSFTPAVTDAPFDTAITTHIQDAAGTGPADGTIALNVNAVNDPPVNTVPGTQEVEANTNTAIGGLSISDPDANTVATTVLAPRVSNGAGNTLTTTLSVAHGTLTVAAVGVGAIVAGGTPSITLTGTVAEINAALGTLVYRGAHDYFGTDILTMVTNDNGHTGSGGALTDTDQVTIHLNTWLTGTPGQDSFTALPGNERIDGLGSDDTITFNFRLVDATVSYEGNKVIVDGPSGSHTVLVGFENFAFSDGVVHNHDGSPLIDDLFYYSHNHDVWNAHVDADAHYNAFGWYEGRDPNAFFSIATYLSANPDVRAAGGNPLLQFDQNGWKEGRVPSIQFDPAAYLAANPDVAAAHIDPLRHYLEFGYQEGRVPLAPSELIAANGFDYVYYLQNNPDVAAAHVDPLQHFQTVGWKEGRNPNALFDTSGYLNTYADVKAAGVNPLDHYNRSGWHEGRDPSVDFDTTSYLAAYPDVNASHGNPLVHFLHFGIHEGRSAFADGVWG